MDDYPLNGEDNVVLIVKRHIDYSLDVFMLV